MNRQPRTGLFRLIAALIGPDQMKERREFCHDFAKTIQRFGLDDEEEKALRSMDQTLLLSLAEAEVSAWLTWFWNLSGEKSPRRAARPAKQSGLATTAVAAMMGDVRSVIESGDARVAIVCPRCDMFLTHREEFALYYQLSEIAHKQVLQMGPETIADDTVFIRDEIHRSFYTQMEILYASAREGLRGAWIESFSVHISEGCRMSLRIEGSGFVACPEIYVLLVSARVIDPNARLVSHPCWDLKVTQTVSDDWLGESPAATGATPSPCATPRAIPREVRVIAPHQNPGSCATITVGKKDIDGWLQGQNIEERVVLARKGRYEPKLTALGLDESLKNTPSAAAFVLEAEFEIGGICAGEYDLWIAQGAVHDACVVALTALAPNPVYVPPCSLP